MGQQRQKQGGAASGKVGQPKRESDGKKAHAAAKESSTAGQPWPHWLASAALAGLALAVFAAAVFGYAGGGGGRHSTSSGDAGARSQATAGGFKPSWASSTPALHRAPQRDVDQKTLPGIEVEPRVVSQSPRIYLFDDLLTAEECDYLIQLADGRLQPAGVVLQTEDKYTLQQSSRNNKQIWLTQQEEKELPILRHVLKRIHRVAHVPDTDAEGLQIGRYGIGEKYEEHLDSDPAHDVTRPATMIIYLNDPEKGGDTLFPLDQRHKCRPGEHEMPNGETRWGCAACCDADVEGTVRIQPRKGRAILFFNHAPSGAMDHRSVHASCPVGAGEKWIAQRWFRLKPYQNLRYAPDVRFDGLPPSSLESASAWDGRVRELSPKAPRIYLLENFLSPSETEHLLQLPDSVLDAGNPMAEGVQRWEIPSDLERDDPVISRIAKRLHRAAYLPEPHSEALVLKKFSAAGLAHRGPLGGQRHATIVIFLSDGEASGAELVFPLGSCKFPACCGGAGVAGGPAGQKAIRVPARRNRAVLLYPDGAPSAEHALCTSSLQQGAVFWTLQRGFRKKASAGVPHSPDAHYDAGRYSGGALVV